MRTCSDCGQELEDLTSPCRNCGGTRQTAHIHASDTAVVTDAIAELSVTLGTDRHWYQKWYDTRKQLELVEDHLKPEMYKGNDAIRRDFESFFLQCIHLGDWLWEDKTTGLSKPAVRSYIMNDPDLRICSAVASTDKHHTRDSPNAMVARIRTTTWNPDAVTVLIEWSEGPSGGQENAQVLPRITRAASPASNP